MFCPNCKSEFREGFTRCAECDVDLVAELEEEWDSESDTDENASESELVMVLETINPGLLSDIVTRLEKVEIPYLVQSGTAFHLVRGLTGGTSSPEWQAVLWVPGDSIEEARRFLREAEEPSAADQAKEDSATET